MHALLVASPLVQLVSDETGWSPTVVCTGCGRDSGHPTRAILDQDLGVVDLKVRGEWTLREHNPSGAKEQVSLLERRSGDRDVGRARSLWSCQFSQGDSSQQLGLAVALGRTQQGALDGALVGRGVVLVDAPDVGTLPRLQSERLAELVALTVNKVGLNPPADQPTPGGWRRTTDRRRVERPLLRCLQRCRLRCSVGRLRCWLPQWWHW